MGANWLDFGYDRRVMIAPSQGGLYTGENPANEGNQKREEGRSKLCGRR
jgi:hypothetical protein